jgi:hypothetical protein
MIRIQIFKPNRMCSNLRKFKLGQILLKIISNTPDYVPWIIC